MKILLIGEYSRLHNSLKEGLIALNHNVTLLGNGDGFKNYPVDLYIAPTFFSKPILFFITKVIDRITSINLLELEYAYKFYKVLPSLKDYDIVQLINENSIKTCPFLEKKLLKKIFKENKKNFLLSCGTDYVSVKYANDKKLKYSILTPLHDNPKLKKHYRFILKYNTRSHFKLHEFIYENINGVISSDLDYHIPLSHHANSKYLGMIPNPINIDKVKLTKIDFNKKIKIFHGINRLNYVKKGNVFFEKALNIIHKKYPDKTEIIIAESIPYDEYIKLYDSCHIVLDQIYAYDQGYNALEAMAKGKVVFTGAEQEWLQHYKLTEDTVAINALPNVESIVEKLEWLILNPCEIEKISRNARAFIEKEHNYINIAKKYITEWEKQ